MGKVDTKGIEVSPVPPSPISDLSLSGPKHGSTAHISVGFWVDDTVWMGKGGFVTDGRVKKSVQ